MSTVFGLTFKRMLKQPFVLSLMFVLPFATLFIPLRPDETTPRLAYGLFALGLMFTSLMLSKQVIEDRQQKTIVRIAAAPLTHKDYLLGHLSAYMITIVVQISLFWALSFVRWDAPASFYFAAFAFLVGFAVMIIAFSLFWHTLFKTYASSMAVYSIVANLMALIGGLSFPLAIMPDNIRRVAVVLPTYWYAYGLEFVTDKDAAGAILSLCILFGFAIIFLVVGSKRRLG